MIVIVLMPSILTTVIAMVMATAVNVTMMIQIMLMITKVTFIRKKVKRTTSDVMVIAIMVADVTMTVMLSIR